MLHIDTQVPTDVAKQTHLILGSYLHPQIPTQNVTNQFHQQL